LNISIYAYLYLYFNRPYLIDLNSSNGTFINGEKLEPSRYYELKQGDVVKFGFSTRDYIFIDEDSV